MDSPLPPKKASVVSNDRKISSIENTYKVEGWSKKIPQKFHHFINIQNIFGVILCFELFFEFRRRRKCHKPIDSLVCAMRVDSCAHDFVFPFSYCNFCWPFRRWRKAMIGIEWFVRFFHLFWTFSQKYDFFTKTCHIFSKMFYI